MLGKLLAKIRNEKNLSLRGLEKIYGMKGSQISRYEKGRTGLKEETAIDILTKGFDIPYSEAKKMILKWQIKEARKKLNEKEIIKEITEFLLDQKNEEILKTINQKIFKKIKTFPAKEKLENNTAFYKKLSDYINQKAPIDYINLGSQTDFFAKYDPKDIYLTVAPDDCMNPTIKKNETIIILKTVSPLENNKIYIINNSLKRFKTIGDINLLTTDNPNCKDEKMNKKTKKIHGQIIGIFKNL